MRTQGAKAVQRGLGLAGLALAIGLGACSNPAKDKPSALVAPANSQALVVQAADSVQQYPFSAGASKIQFVGSKITGSHHGSFEKFSGSVRLAQGKIEGGHVRVDIEMESVKTDSARLDEHLKTADFFDVAQYPQASFVSTDIKASGDKAFSHFVTGQLTLHGVTKTITFPVTINVSDEQITARSEFSINRKDFQLVYPGRPNDLIRDEVLLELNLTVSRQGS